MELEFDKEINAILRKARDSGAADAVVPAGHHVDADAIAAFAENALPEKARLSYMTHLADCERCRTMLSDSISPMEAEAAPAASTSATPAVERVIPWFERLFRTPNLAMAMGSLVLAFSALLGYLAIDRMGKSNEADVAQISNSEPRLNGPNYDPNAASTAANTNSAAAMPSATAMPAANAVANAMVSANAMASKPAAPTVSGSMSPADTKRSDAAAGAALDSDAPRPVMAAPPPPAVSQPSSAADERKQEPSKLKENPADSSLAKSDIANESGNDAAKPKAKRAPSGPSKNSIQMQQQESSAMGSGAFENTARKRVGGKTFEHRNGVWYDTTYHGHATQNYRRGTDEYKKLDSGLRSIADSVGGTVVLVWKEKSYRIQ